MINIYKFIIFFDLLNLNNTIKSVTNIQAYIYYRVHTSHFNIDFKC